MFLTIAAAAVPVIVAPVTDEADALEPHAEVELEAALREMRDATGVQMAVLTVRSLPYDHTVESFSLAVAEAWGGGSTRDDGALLVLAIRDRRSRLELGYGLEGYVTDAEAGAMLGRAIPALQEGDIGAAALGVVEDVRDQVDGLEPGGAIPAYRSAIALAGRAAPTGPLLTGAFAVLGSLGFGGFVLAMARPAGVPWVKRLPHGGRIALATLAAVGVLVAMLWPLVPVPLGRVALGLATGLFVVVPVGLAEDGKLLAGSIVAVGLSLALVTGLAAYLGPADDLQVWIAALFLAWVAPLFLAVGGWRTGGGGGGSGYSGDTYSSGSSSSGSSSSGSSSSGSSSSSSGDDWRGGGGGFGGGGASSGW